MIVYGCKKMNRVTNHEILKFFSKEENEDIQKNFVGAFPSTFINRFISFHSITKNNEEHQYPFLIVNIDRFDKKGTHWWRFLDIHPKKEVFLFDSFLFSGLKEFFIQDDRKIINMLMYNLKKFNKTSNKIILISIKFSMSEFEKTEKKVSNILNTTFIDFFSHIK